MAISSPPLSKPTDALRQHYDAGMQALQAKEYEKAIGYFGVVMHGSRVNDTDIFVSDELGRSASYNMGIAACMHGDALARMVSDGRLSEEQRTAGAGQAREAFELAAQAFDAARADERGQVIADPDAALQRASVGLHSVGFDTATANVDGLKMQMRGGRLSVAALQLDELRRVRDAVGTAETVNPYATREHAVADIASHTASLRAEEALRRVQFLGAVSAGALAALAEGTHDVSPAVLSYASAVSMGDVARFAAAVRRAAIRANAEVRETLHDPKSWANMWRGYIEEQLADVQVSDPRIAQEIEKVREMFAAA